VSLSDLLISAVVAKVAADDAAKTETGKAVEALITGVDVTRRSQDFMYRATRALLNTPPSWHTPAITVGQASASAVASEGRRIFQRPDLYRIRGLGDAFVKNTVNYASMAGIRNSTSGGAQLNGVNWNVTIDYEDAWLSLELMSQVQKYTILVTDPETGETWNIQPAGIAVATSTTVDLVFPLAMRRLITVICGADGGMRGVRAAPTANWRPIQPDSDKTVVMTDSYGFTLSPMPDRTGLSPFDWMREALDADVIGHSIGASGYLAGFPVTHEYRIEDAIATGASRVMVAIGGNDFTSASPVYTSTQYVAALRSFVSGFRREGGSAKIGIVGPMPGRYNTTVDSPTKARLVEFDNAAIAACAADGIPYHSLLRSGFMNGSITAKAGSSGEAGLSGTRLGDDDTHCTQSGAREYGLELARAAQTLFTTTQVTKIPKILANLEE